MNVSGDTGLIWVNPLALALGKLAQLQLDTAGRHDQPGTRIVASGLLPTHYLLLQMHLKTFGGCDVHSFPFDWRHTPALAAQQLRTLMKNVHAHSGQQIHLVGHSMGGLVARAYCETYPEEASQMIAQVVQLGTPNYGSFVALQSLISEEGLVGLLRKINPANDPLAFTRSCPGFYAMFPAPRAAFPSDAPYAYPYDDHVDIYNGTSYGITGLSETHLRAARRHYQNIGSGAALGVPCTIVAGYGLATATSLAFERANGATTFRFVGAGDGDGTVPLASAAALPGARLLFGRGLKHGDLPLYGAVRDAVIALVHGRTPTTLEQEPYAKTLDSIPDLTLSVPEAPTPGELDAATTSAIAERFQAGTPLPGDLRALALL